MFDCFGSDGFFRIQYCLSDIDLSVDLDLPTHMAFGFHANHRLGINGIRHKGKEEEEDNMHFDSHFYFVDSIV